MLQSATQTALRLEDACELVATAESAEREQEGVEVAVAPGAVVVASATGHAAESAAGLGAESASRLAAGSSDGHSRAMPAEPVQRLEASSGKAITYVLTVCEYMRSKIDITGTQEGKITAFKLIAFVGMMLPPPECVTLFPPPSRQPKAVRGFKQLKIIFKADAYAEARGRNPKS